MEILSKVVMDGNSSTLTAEKLTEMIGDPKVKVIGFYNHAKAGEKYVQMELSGSGEVCRGWVMPYVYRRTNTFIYHGNEKWDSKFPAKGKAAEGGCVGCFWYDMDA